MEFVLVDAGNILHLALVSSAWMAGEKSFSSSLLAPHKRSLCNCSSTSLYTRGLPEVGNLKHIQFAFSKKQRKQDTLHGPQVIGKYEVIFISMHLKSFLYCCL